MKRLPDLLIVACVLLLMMSMSALSQTNSSVTTDRVSSSSRKAELPKLIVRSAAKGSWAAARYASDKVIIPSSRYVATQVVENTGPKLASAAYRTLVVAAKSTTRAGRSSARYLKAKLTR